MNDTQTEVLQRAAATLVGDVPLSVTLDALGEACIEEAIRRADGNVTVAAGLLGVHRNTIYNRRRRGER